MEALFFSIAMVTAACERTTQQTLVVLQFVKQLPRFGLDGTSISSRKFCGADIHVLPFEEITVLINSKKLGP
jgi:hypothetical protein